MKLAVSTLRKPLGNLEELPDKAAIFFVTYFPKNIPPKIENLPRLKRGLSKLFSWLLPSILIFTEYQFKQLIKPKRLQLSKEVIDSNEKYKSRTVSWNGEIINNLTSTKLIRWTDGRGMFTRQKGRKVNFSLYPR